MFSKGRIFEELTGRIYRPAKVIAITDGGRVGWLEFLDTQAPLFELDRANGSIWKQVQHG